MDADLQSIQEARDLVTAAAAAQRAFANASQEEVDRVVAAMALASSAAAATLARAAVDETKMGVYEHKIVKNKFAAEVVHEFIRPLKTVGVLREDRSRKVRELAVPMGVVGAIVPTTNPTSTAIYKALISVKARNAIVMSPHPRAVQCTVQTGRILHDAAVAAGAPPGLVAVMSRPSLEGTTALMRHPETSVILATGGADMVKAVYAAGKPAYGVGPGNVPAIIERSAQLGKAVADVVDGKTFDAGVLCSSENSVVVDAPVSERVRALFKRERAHFCSPNEKVLLEHYMIPASGKGINPDVVGVQPELIASRAGFSVPSGTKLLIVELREVGRADPLSREKLCPVLGFFVEDGWEKCCERAIQLLRLGGMGHSLGLHCRDPHVIDRFFHEKPAFRIVLNSNTSVGAVGFTTGFAPAMTLGPGSWGGSITSDNITPLHLLNLKRIGEEIRPYHDPLRATQALAPSHKSLTISNSAADTAALNVQGIVDEFLVSFRASRQ